MSRHSGGSVRAAALLVGALLLAGCADGAPSDGGAPSGGGTPATRQQLAGFFGNGLAVTDRGAFGVDRARLLTTADAPGGALLRVGYPAGSASRRATGEDGGMQAYLRLPDRPRDELTLRYHVRFPPGFDFVKGGKLPGLYGGTVTGGQHIPDGTDGFSTRYMWRSGGAGEVYAYLPTSVHHGTSFGRGCWSFPTGRWVSIQQRVRLNTPGGSDGEIVVWRDGRQVLRQRGLTFRTTDRLAIDGVFFSTFFGGGDRSWASPVDQHADFAGFTLSPDVIPPSGGPTENDDTCRATGVPTVS